MPQRRGHVRALQRGCDALVRARSNCACAWPIAGTMSWQCKSRDRYELELPAMGRLTLEDAETGEIVEPEHWPRRAAATRLRCASRKRIEELARQFRSPALTPFNSHTDEAYSAALGRFFENREKRAFVDEILTMTANTSERPPRSSVEHLRLAGSICRPAECHSASDDCDLRSDRIPATGSPTVSGVTPKQLAGGGCYPQITDVPGNP